MGTYIFMHVALARAAEGLNGKDFALLHLCLILVLYEGNTFATVNVVLPDVMATDVPYRSNRICLAPYGDFIALHRFLNGSANITDADINTCGLW